MIKGYRDLSQEEIDLMNEAKELAEKVGVLVDKLRETDGLDNKWLEAGVMDLQTGFMKTIRSIARSSTF